MNITDSIKTHTASRYSFRKRDNSVGKIIPSVSRSLSSKLSKNVSPLDYLLGRINFLRKYPMALKTYRNAFSNYIPVMRAIYRRRYPVIGILRSGASIKIHNEREAWYAALSQKRRSASDSYDIIYDIGNELIKIKSRDKPEGVSVYQSITNGDVWGVFVKQEYSRLPVKDRIVVDIGANIGDSSIYFALRGAKKVIGLEPFPKNFQIAKQNITTNRLEDTVILVLAGCSDRLGEITIEHEHAGSAISHIREYDIGIKVPLLTLQKIIEDYDLPNDAVLKMDCEGCEYDSILKTSRDVLRKFANIQLEYHYGFRNLSEKLKSFGFAVTASTPTRWFQVETEQLFYSGTILASRRA